MNPIWVERRDASWTGVLVISRRRWAFLSSRGGRVGRYLDLTKRFGGSNDGIESQLGGRKEEGNGDGGEETDTHRHFRTPLPDLFLSLNYVNIIIDSNYPAPVLC